MTSGNSEKAEELNKFFSSVFTDEDKTSISTLEERQNKNPTNTVKIIAAHVCKKLKKLVKPSQPALAFFTQGFFLSASTA